MKKILSTSVILFFVGISLAVAHVGKSTCALQVVGSSNEHLGKCTVASGCYGAPSSVCTLKTDSGSTVAIWSSNTKNLYYVEVLSCEKDNGSDNTFRNPKEISCDELNKWYNCDGTLTKSSTCS